MCVFTTINYKIPGNVSKLDHTLMYPVRLDGVFASGNLLDIHKSLFETVHILEIPYFRILS